MYLETVFLLLVVLAIVVLFVAAPFASRWRVQTASRQESSALLAERDRLLTTLQELDFDHSLGKIPDEEYPAQRLLLLQRGADILRQLDEIQAPGVKARDASRAAQPAISLSEDDLEDLIAQRRAARKGKAAGSCSKCGKPVSKSDQFCSSCGQAVE